MAVNLIDPIYTIKFTTNEKVTIYINCPYTAKRLP